MLSDSPLKKHVKSPKKRAETAVQQPYSDNQKLEAVKAWLLTGNLAQVAVSLGIYYPTLRAWRYSNWWKEAVDELKQQNSMALTARLRVITEKALAATEDRIVNGEWFYDQISGELKRKPVQLRDVHRVAVDMIKNTIEIERKPVEELNQKVVIDRIDALRQTFESFARTGRYKKLDITDIEVNDAVHEGGTQSPRGNSLQSIESSGTVGLYEGKESGILPEKGGDVSQEETDSRDAYSVL